MTTLDIVFVGLCAIVTEAEIDCRHPRPAGLTDTEPFQVVLFDPGVPQVHDPNLWVRIDGLKTLPPTGECFLGTESKPPKAGTSAAANCTSDTDKKWKMWSIRGKEVRIIQDETETAKLNQGRRKLGGRCWKGKKAEDGKSCKNPGQIEKCKRDVSWVPEFAKVNGRGIIRESALDDPAADSVVSAVLRDLRGRYEADEPGDDPWQWAWNYPRCGASVPRYEQTFAQSAAIRGIKASTEAIYLVNLRRGVETEIELGSAAKVVVRNLPPGPMKLIEVGERCYIPHFDAYAAVAESPPVCRRVPYIPRPMTGCPDFVGVDDPFCPPTTFGRRDKSVP